MNPLQTLKKSDENFYFSNYCKAIKYICGVQVSGQYVSQGCQNRGSNIGYKNGF